MRATICAALCACTFATGLVAGPANAADYGTGYGRHGGYRAPVRHGPRHVRVKNVPYAAYAYERYAPPRVYYLPVERRQAVRFSEFNYSGLDAYAAADDIYAVADEDCRLQKIPNWDGGWVWARRAGCF